MSDCIVTKVRDGFGTIIVFTDEISRSAYQNYVNHGVDTGESVISEIGDGEIYPWLRV